MYDMRRACAARRGLLAFVATMGIGASGWEDSPTSTRRSWRFPALATAAAGAPPRRAGRGPWTLRHRALESCCAGRRRRHCCVRSKHHMPLVMSLSDHVVLLDAGRVIAAGSPAQVRQDEASARPISASAGTENSHDQPQEAHVRNVCLCPAAQRGLRCRAGVRGVDLTVHTREMITVLGANGAGKSTLMRALKA